MSTVPKNKQQLLQAITTEHAKIMQTYENIPACLSRKIGVEGNKKGDFISVADTLAYLMGWGTLVIQWIEQTEQNLPTDFPTTGYKWTQLGQLAKKFYQDYADWQYTDLIHAYTHIIDRIISIIHRMDNAQLYEKTWYKTHTMGRMIQLNTYSPMKNMHIKIKRFLKKSNNNRNIPFPLT